MDIRVERKFFGPCTCLSVLKVDGETRGYILEDKDRGLTSAMPLKDIREKKKAGVTAIPTGRYQVSMTHSPRFGRKMPLLNDVPGFAGIRIHSGNYHEDTEGCLLPGKSYGKDAGSGDYYVLQSRQLTEELEKEIVEALDRGEKVWCEIVRT